MTESIQADRAAPRLPGALAAGVLAVFFLTGACGLIHEVVWTRLLRLVMGNTTFSITTVLCAFMGGLALGSYVGGRIIDRRNDPLRVFAMMEALVGAYCALLPWLIGAMEPAYRYLYQNVHASAYGFSLIQFVFSGALLLIPATFMGATLPVLSRFFSLRSGRVGRSVATVYAVNTFGAVAGAMAAGFVLIAALGVTRTIYLASLLNLTGAALAYLLHRRVRAWEARAVPAVPAEAVARPAEAPAAAGLEYGRASLVVLLAGYGLSGAAAMVYEIAWTRVISLLIGSSTYAFSMMLIAFILGLAAGSMILGRFVDRLRDPMRVLAVVEICIAASCLAVVPAIDQLPFVATRLIARLLNSFWLLQAAEFGLIVLMMLVPTLLMGMAFPLAAKLFARSRAAVGRSVGTVYGFNTLGCIAGSFAGGFILIPVLGIQRSIFAAAGVNALVACAFFLLSRSLGPVRRLAAAAVGGGVIAAAIAFTPAWTPAYLSFGPFRQAGDQDAKTLQSHQALREAAEEGDILFHKEGICTTITVKEFDGTDRVLYVNGKPDASTYSDLPTQLMVAQVPLLLHPAPKRVVVIGLASGITLGSATLHPVEKVDCVEIAPEMPQACRYFDEHNHRVLDDPRVRVLAADGRNHLALTAEQYDVIISEPSNPWIAGVADLFTREFFDLCRRRLAPGGIACIWLNTYDMDVRCFRSIIRTFGEVFPDMSLWSPMECDYMLVGTRDAAPADREVVLRRLADPAIAEELERVDISSLDDLLKHLVMGPKAARAFAAGAPLHTDDNALLEFVLPRTTLASESEEDLEETVEEHRDSDASFLFAPSVAE